MKEERGKRFKTENNQKKTPQNHQSEERTILCSEHEKCESLNALRDD